MSKGRAMLGEAKKRTPQPRVRFLDGAADAQVTAEAAQARPVRNMRITFDDLRKHGFDM